MAELKVTIHNPTGERPRVLCEFEHMEGEGVHDRETVVRRLVMNRSGSVITERKTADDAMGSPVWSRQSTQRSLETDALIMLVSLHYLEPGDIVFLTENRGNFEVRVQRPKSLT